MDTQTIPSPSANGKTQYKQSGENTVCKLCWREIKQGDRVMKIPNPENEVRGRNWSWWVHPQCGKDHLEGMDLGRMHPDLVDVLRSSQLTIQNMKEYIESLEARIDDIVLNAPPQKVFLQEPKKVSVQVDGLVHEAFPRFAKLAHVGIPIYIYGPRGCGKNTLCEQYAKARNLHFGFVSCTQGMSEAKLTGCSRPTGATGEWQFRTTDFVNCYEQGGVYLIDEMDAADPNVMLCIQAAIAGNQLPLVDRPKKPYAEKSPDFVLIGAGNTDGKGATEDYHARSKMDAAFLDRFLPFPMTYDPVLEKKICPDKELYDFFIGVRALIESTNTVGYSVGTRTLANYSKMLRYGFTVDDCVERFFSNWSDIARQRCDPTRQ